MYCEINCEELGSMSAVKQSLKSLIIYNYEGSFCFYLMDHDKQGKNDIIMSFMSYYVYGISTSERPHKIMT